MPNYVPLKIFTTVSVRKMPGEVEVLPKLLFRYYGVKEYWIDVLKNRRLYAPKKEQLNDPYEMKFTPSIEFVSRQKIKRKSIEIMTNKGISRKEAILRYKRARDRGAIEEGSTPEFIEKMAQSIFEGMGILSFTENIEHLLMWSHYAAGHKGMCFGFEMNRSEQRILGYAEKVEYSDEIPEIAPYQNSRDPRCMLKAVLHKAAAWAYEKEWRTVMDRKTYKYLRFMEEELKSVYFGIRMSEDDKKEAVDLLKDFKAQVEIYEMVESKSLYKFDEPRRMKI